MDNDYEMIFVNDGSRDATMDIMSVVAKEDKHVKIVEFARNFGHQVAVTAGMLYCSGDAAVIIDADLQDPRSLFLICSINGRKATRWFTESALSATANLPSSFYG